MYAEIKDTSMWNQVNRTESGFKKTEINFSRTFNKKGITVVIFGIFSTKNSWNYRGHLNYHF